MTRHRTGITILGAGLVAASLSFAAAAQAQKAPECKVHAVERLPVPRLARMTARLEEGLPVTIVALGSSSTAGALASSPDRAYPARLQAYLQRMYPYSDIRVVNLGRNGAASAALLERLQKEAPVDADVLAFQGGAIAALNGTDPARAQAGLESIIDHAQRRGMDVFMIDMQNTPKMETRAGLGAMLAMMGRVARTRGVGLFQRHTLMNNWKNADRIAPQTYTAPDDLHMNDWGYDCLAYNIAHYIRRAAAPTVQVARPLP